MVFSNSDASPLRRRGGPRQNLVACLMLFTHNPALLMNDCLPQRMRTNFFPYTEKGHPQIRARPAYRMKTAAKKQGRFYTGPLLPPGADLLFQMQTQWDKYKKKIVFCQSFSKIFSCIPESCSPGSQDFSEKCRIFLWHIQSSKTRKEIADSEKTASAFIKQRNVTEINLQRSLR